MTMIGGPERVSLNQNKFTINPKQKEGIFNAALGLVKGMFRTNNDGRFEAIFEGGQISVAMRNSSPPPLHGHNWTPVNIEDEHGTIRQIWLNINSLAKSTHVAVSYLQAMKNTKNMERFLDEATTTDQQNYVDFHAVAREIRNEGLASRPPNTKEPTLPNATQIYSAKRFINRTANQDLLARKLDDAKQHGNPYCVIKKEESGLDYNIEYHGPGKAFLRYGKDFRTGGSKEASKMVDLFTGELIVKTKTVVSSMKDANAYRAKRGRGKREPYATYEIKKQDALDEAALGQGLNEVLQAKGPAIEYTKGTVGSGAYVEKVASYTPLQKGNIEARYFSIPERVEISRLLVNNVAEFHRQGNGHNDIKDLNFLWTKNNNQFVTKIIDLGTAGSLQSRNNYHNGTPLYFPPNV